MDIVNYYMPYVAENDQLLPTQIRHNGGLAIVRKYTNLCDELAKLRIGTLGACSVTEKGLLKIDNRPGLAVSLERIKELEARVDHMIDICDRCNAVYDELGVTDPHSVDQDPLTRYESARQTLDGAHHAVWQRLEHDHQQSPLAFPSEVISEPSLAAYERERMDMREKARKEVEFLKAGLHRLDDLYTEARNV